jgi:hypothetical protein
MRYVELPVLPRDATPTVALAAMYAHNRLAVVTVNDNATVHVIRALQLRRAIRAGVKALKGVKESIVVAVPVVKPMKRVIGGSKWFTTDSAFAVAPPHGGAEIGGIVRGIQPALQYVDEYAIDARFESAVFNRYALASMTIGRAVIVTHHENEGDVLIGAPTTCYCTDPVWQHPASPHDKLCPFGDGSTVEC